MKANGDLDYLAARAHGRRSNMAERERLDGLCQAANLAEVVHRVSPQTKLAGAREFQRWLVQRLLDEVSELSNDLKGSNAELLKWFLVRFQLENIKVLLRAFMAHRTPLEIATHGLVELPEALAVNTGKLLSAASMEEFAFALPTGVIGDTFNQALRFYGEQKSPFLLENALEAGYLRQLIATGLNLTGTERELIQPILFQETDAFHLLLVVRARFHYGLNGELLLPFHVGGTGISCFRFRAMLAAPDIVTVARLTVGRAIDLLPSGSSPSTAAADLNIGALEALAGNRFLRLSNRAFRRGHMGAAALVGYVGLRRVEVANLITISEGVDTDMDDEALRARLLPRSEMEAVHV